VVSVFGPTVPRFGYTAFGTETRIVEHPQLPCRPCDRHGPVRCPLGHFRCMREVPAENVLQQLDSLLRPPARRFGTASGR
jgi:heptosyltransferase-2